MASCLDLRFGLLDAFLEELNYALHIRIASREPALGGSHSQCLLDPLVQIIIKGRLGGPQSRTGLRPRMLGRSAARLRRRIQRSAREPVLARHSSLHQAPVGPGLGV